MARHKPRTVDASVRAIYQALCCEFPGQSAKIEDVVYRKDSFTIRVRVVDPRFRGKTLRERERMVLTALKKHAVDESDVFNITMLLTRTPDESDEEFVTDTEFFDPAPSRL